MESTNQERALIIVARCVICISSRGEILKSFICLMALTSITCTDNICLSNPRHPEGAFTPVRSGSAAGSVSVFCAGQVFTQARAVSLCRSLILQHWVFDLWILTSQHSLFLWVPQKNHSASDLCGCPHQARRGGLADPRRCKQHHTISTNLSTAEPMHTMDMLWKKLQWILALYMKPISFQSKASVVCSVTAAVFIDFCLKRLNVFSQHIGKKTNEYLNSIEQIHRNWNVDQLFLSITS